MMLKIDLTRIQNEYTLYRKCKIAESCFNKLALYIGMRHMEHWLTIPFTLDT
jgi:hypothetical protein